MKLVTLTGILGTQFKGFMLQARLVKSPVIIGSWIFDNTHTVENEFMGVLKCSQNNVIKSSITFFEKKINYNRAYFHSIFF